MMLDTVHNYDFCVTTNMSSIDTTGNLFEFFNTMIRKEIVERLGAYELDKQNLGTDITVSKAKVNEAIEFHKKLIETISLEGSTKFLSNKICKILAPEQFNLQEKLRGIDIIEEAKNKILFNKNGIKFYIKRDSDMSKQGIFKKDSYSGQVDAGQPPVAVTPTVIGFDDLKKTHDVLEISLPAYNNIILPSYKLIVAISKHSCDVHLLFGKLKQESDDGVDLLALIDYILNISEEIKTTPEVLLKTITENSDFKGSLVDSQAISSELARDIFKIHFLSFVANSLSLTKKLTELTGGTRSEITQWYNPFVSAFLILRLMIIENKKYLSEGRNDDLNVHKDYIDMYMLTINSIFPTYGRKRKAKDVLKALINTDIGASENSLSLIFRDKDEMKELSDKIEKLSHINNLVAVIRYINLLSERSDNKQYNEIYCGEELLEEPVTFNNKLSYKRPRYFTETGYDDDLKVNFFPITSFTSLV